MNPEQVRHLFQQTLADRKVTGGEKRVINQLVDHLDPTPQSLALYRNLAFSLAREEMTDGDSKAVLEWLEDVIKLLLPGSSTGQSSLAETHFSPGDDCPTRIATQIRLAKRSIEICVFTITDDRITEAIIDAHRRGIQVRIITDNDKALDLGSDIPQLQAAGVPLRMDETPFHMHHKFAIFDSSSLLTGSYNWTRSASRDNEENFIITSEPRLVQPFAELFESLWKKFA